MDNNIYIAVEYSEGIFKPNLFKNMLKYKPIREYFQVIHLMLGIVEEFYNK